MVFLAEAFTRPAMMQSLAMVGFQQSYSYFTWRNTKSELEEFLTWVSQETADFMRPNLFVNTPDILTEYLQFGGPAAFTVRATIAATASPTWGVYAGFELFESVARPGAEEKIDNEKYEYKPRDFAAAEQAGKSLALYLGILNGIRNAHPALGQLRNLRFHASEDDSVLVYSKHLDGRFTPDGRDDTVIVSRTSTRTPSGRPPCTSTSPPSDSRPARPSRSKTSSPATAGNGATPTTCASTRSRGPCTSCTSCGVRMSEQLPPTGPVIADDVLAAVAEGRHSDPHSVLGQHGFDIAGSPGTHTVIRTRRPLADSVDALLDDDTVVPLAHVGHGIWAGTGDFGPVGYHIRARYGADEWVADDPYRFVPTIGELDLYLIGEGRHEQLWQVLGANHREHWGTGGGVRGTSFTVWAPHARAVRVVGDFNRWDGVGHAMRRIGATGVWELFVPDLEPGAAYKFEILTGSGGVGHEGRPDGTPGRDRTGHRVGRQRHLARVG